MVNDTHITKLRVEKELLKTHYFSLNIIFKVYLNTLRYLSRTYSKEKITPLLHTLNDIWTYNCRGYRPYLSESIFTFKVSFYQIKFCNKSLLQPSSPLL